MVEETFDVEFDENNGSHGASDNLDDVGGEPLRDAIKNMPVGDIKPKEDDDDVRVIDALSSSHVPQDEDKDVRDAHEDTQVTHEQAVAQAQDVDAPHATLQVAARRTSHLLQDHSQDLIIGSPSRCVTTCSKHALFIKHHAFVSLEDEPKIIEEAPCDTDWIIAMQEELNNFSRNQVWTIEERPKDARVIGTKWVFQNKKDDQGKVVHNKARLVAKSCSQVEGLDFSETFAPMARLEAICILLAYASGHDIKLFQMNVKIAF